MVIYKLLISSSIAGLLHEAETNAKRHVVKQLVSTVVCSTY